MYSLQLLDNVIRQSECKVIYHLPMILYILLGMPTWYSREITKILSNHTMIRSTDLKLMLDY